MKNIVKVLAVIVGTVIGAGFASGQEIKLFFNNYSANGFYGIVVSSILIAVIIYKVFIIMINNNITTYQDFSNTIFTMKNKVIKNSIQNLVNIFLFISFYIMIAGFSAYFEQELNISKYIGGAIIAVLCYVTLMRNINRHY